MEAFALNKSNGKLHIKSCRLIKDMEHYEVSNVAEKVLENHSEKVECCKACLRKNSEIQALVEVHNQKKRKQKLK